MKNCGLHGRPSLIQNEKDLTFLVHIIAFIGSQDFLFKNKFMIYFSWVDYKVFEVVFKRNIETLAK
jgi:hypothetical protein